MAVTTISPPELAGRLKRGEAHDLIDVRTPVEYREVHVGVAQNVPLDELDPAALMQARNGKGRPRYLFQLSPHSSRPAKKTSHEGQLRTIQCQK